MIGNPMTTSYHGMIEEVHVMLVDHDRGFADEMIDLLKPYGYKVTMVPMAFTAMTMLSNEKKKIDVMIINVHSPDLCSFSLLAQAVALDIISLVICDEYNEHLAVKALNSGAYLFLEKPLGKKIVNYLWQFLLRQKNQKEKSREGLLEENDPMNVDDIGRNNIIEDNEKQAGEKNNVPNTEAQNNNIHEAINNIASNEKGKSRKERCGKGSNKINKQKRYLQWTEDLHTKFMEAVQYLGEGRCYPQDILKIMNIPDITRMQIASHLQKCRTNKWKALQMQQFSCRPIGQRSSISSRQRGTTRKIGKMARLQANVPNLQQQLCNPNQAQIGRELPSPALNTSNFFSEGESSIQQQPSWPQLQVQSLNLTTRNPLNSPLMSAQNNVGGGLQQHDPLFDMLESEGLQGPITGSTYYNPELAFDGGDHHAQNNYNLDVNVVGVLAYSGITTKFDTNVGNETINGLGAADANFQQYINEQNISDPNNIVAASDANEKENSDVCFSLDDFDFLLKSDEFPSFDLLDEQSSEFDQVYSDDQMIKPNVQLLEIANCIDNQVTATSSVQVPEIANFSDNQVTEISNVQFSEIAIPDNSQHDPMLLETISDNSQNCIFDFAEDFFF